MIKSLIVSSPYNFIALGVLLISLAYIICYAKRKVRKEIKDEGTHDEKLAKMIGQVIAQTLLDCGVIKPSNINQKPNGKQEPKKEQ